MKIITAFLKKYKNIMLAVIFIFIFLFFAEDLLENTLEKFDNFVYEIIKPNISPFFTTFFKIVTNASSSVFLLGFCLILMLVFKRKKYRFLYFINLANVVLLNVILKEIFSRPRPEELMLITESGYSFPSGHSMAAMAFYGFIIYLINKTGWKRTTKIFSSIGLSILIFLIGLSRIYLGVHYASDVVAGFSISLAYLLIFTFIVSKYINESSENNENYKK